MSEYISITKRTAEARKLDRLEYEQKEVAKRGNLRAGNSGIMSVEGQVAGGCHRVAHLRQLGIELDPPGEHALLMFELGYANEDRIYSDLNRTLQPGEVILREDEIPIEWFTGNGTRVSGRPDLVIGTMNYNLAETEAKSGFVPKLAVEIKSVHSVWVARDVLFSGKPKLENVIQVAHYMWKLGGTPGKLMYRQYSQQSMPKFGFVAPAKGEKFSEFVEYNEKGGAKHIRQFQVVYDVKIDSEGRVSYKHEDAEAWTPTLVNTADIGRYFEYVSQMAEKKTLGPELLLIDLSGEEKGYSHEAYCDACKLARDSKSYEDFIEKARAITSVIPLVEKLGGSK